MKVNDRNESDSVYHMTIFPKHPCQAALTNEPETHQPNRAGQNNTVGKYVPGSLSGVSSVQLPYCSVCEA